MKSSRCRMAIDRRTTATDKEATHEPSLPVLLKSQPQSKSPVSDIHRFWEQTGSFYAAAWATTRSPIRSSGWERCPR